MKFSGDVCEHWQRVYMPNVVRGSEVRKECHLFRKGQLNSRDEEGNSRLKIKADGLVEGVNAKICKTWEFIFYNNCLFIFFSVSWSIICDIMTKTFFSKKLCAKNVNHYI